MSKEYIEREALLKECSDTISNIQFSSPYQDEIDAMVSGMERIRDNIYDAPAADVAPVVHAHWKTREAKNDYLWVECSNCGFLVENYKAVKTGRSSTDVIGNKWNGCPCCGARMDGGK